ncbi:MAG: PP2C family protein-serine/threonine phosphatase [Phycisphaerales bacterium]
MKILNPPEDPRVVRCVEMVRALSVADEPYEVLRTFAMHYWPLHPIDHMLSVSRAGLSGGEYRITRNVDVRRALREGGLPAQAGDRRREEIPVSRGGFIGWAIEQGRPLLLERVEVRGDPVLGDALAGMRSAVSVPLYDLGEPRYWNIQLRREPGGFSMEDLERALMVGNFVGGTNTRLLLMREVKRLNAALVQQFEEVARVQQALLPRQIPEIPGLEIATSYLTSDRAGGDYYDFFPLEEGKWGVLIADVSGHGAAAATIMAMLHGILHAYTGPGRTPDAVLRYANRKLCEARLEGNFVTAFFAVWDPVTARLTYARSGHNPPLLKHGGTGAVTHLDGDGAPPLGLFEPYEIGSEVVQLRPGDTVILYTDGITEAFSAPPGREMFGTERLDEALTRCTGAPDCVVDTVHTALYQHTGSRGRADDQTLVAMRYVGR